MAKLFHRTPGGNVPHPGNRLRPLERHSDGAELGRYGLYHGTFRPGVQGYVAAFGGAIQAPPKGISSMAAILSSSGWPATWSCVRIRRRTSSRTKKNPSKRSTESWRPSWHWIAVSATGQAAAVSMMNEALLCFKYQFFSSIKYCFKVGIRHNRKPIETYWLNGFIRKIANISSC